MELHWLQRNFFSNIKYTFVDGTTGRNIVLFGIPLMLRPDLEIKEYDGFMISLYDIGIVKPGLDITNIGLLRNVIGPEISAEIPHPQDALTAVVSGHEYTITPVTRFNAYERLKRWHKTKICTVYSITSPTDKDLPQFTWARSEWRGLIPSAHEVVNSAHEIHRMVQGI